MHIFSTNLMLIRISYMWNIFFFIFQVGNNFLNFFQFWFFQTKRVNIVRFMKFFRIQKIKFKKIIFITIIIVFRKIFTKLRFIFSLLITAFRHLFQHYPSIKITYIPILEIWQFFIFIFHIFVISFHILINSATYSTSNTFHYQ